MTCQPPDGRTGTELSRQSKVHLDCGRHFIELIPPASLYCQFLQVSGWRQQTFHLGSGRISQNGIKLHERLHAISMEPFRTSSNAFADRPENLESCPVRPRAERTQEQQDAHACHEPKHNLARCVAREHGRTCGRSPNARTQADNDSFPKEPTPFESAGADDKPRPPADHAQAAAKPNQKSGQAFPRRCIGDQQNDREGTKDEGDAEPKHRKHDSGGRVIDDGSDGLQHRA